MLLKDPRIAGDEQDTAAFIQAAVSEGRFLGHRRRAGNRSYRWRKQQSENDAS